MLICIRAIIIFDFKGPLVTGLPHPYSPTLKLTKSDEGSHICKVHAETFKIMF